MQTGMGVFTVLGGGVPGWFSTYWMKMLCDIEVLDQPDKNFWTTVAYHIPDTPGGNVTPDQTGYNLVPISRTQSRSFITNLQTGDHVSAGSPVPVRGIAFGGGSGVARVNLSTDGGTTWRATRLGPDIGKYSFRRWQAPGTAPARHADLESRRLYTQLYRDHHADRYLIAQRHALCRRFAMIVLHKARMLGMLGAVGMVGLGLIAGAGPAPTSVTAAGVTLTSETVMLPGSSQVFPITLAVPAPCRPMGPASPAIPPNLTKTVWQAVVMQMITQFQAPIVASDVQPIVDYLTSIKGKS